MNQEQAKELALGVLKALPYKLIKGQPEYLIEQLAKAILLLATTSQSSAISIETHSPSGVDIREGQW